MKKNLFAFITGLFFVLVFNSCKKEEPTPPPPPPPLPAVGGIVPGGAILS